MLTLLAMLSSGHAGILDVPAKYNTIQDALNAAASGDEIVLAPGSYCEELVVTKSVTIRADLPQTAIIDGFCITKEAMLSTSAESLTLRDLVLEGGFSTTPLSVDEGEVSGAGLAIRYGYSSGDGGGVRVRSGGTFSCTGCKIQENYALGKGGGIHSLGTVALVDSLVCQNTSEGRGGGLYLDGRSIVRRTGFARNYAQERGGGVWVQGFGGHQLHNTVFLDNDKAPTPAGGAGLHVGDAADVRNSIFVGHRNDISLDNDDEVNTGGHNLYADNLVGDVSEPYPNDIRNGIVALSYEGFGCEVDLSLVNSPNLNPDAIGTGDPALASSTYPLDRGLVGGLEDGAPDSDGDLFPDAIDCDPFDPTVYPGAFEDCNGVDDDCDGAIPTDELDDDDDGFRTCEGDCDDSEPTAYPGGPLVVGDGVDNDCDGVGECYVDDDDDGYGISSIVNAPNNTCDAGLASMSGDCNDETSAANPAEQEVCDGIDNDCDDATDDEDSDVVGQQTWYLDGDGDGFGTIAVTACFPPDGAVTQPGDCDDNDSDVNPDAIEVCNGIDDDCDDAIDDDDDDVTGQTTGWLDSDSDGYGDLANPLTTCTLPSTHVLDNTDCDDTDDAENPGANELCDGTDNDCDGAVDDADPDVLGQGTWYQDTDNDGFGDPDSTTELACSRPIGTSATFDDCDDTDVNTYPGAPEQCDSVDNNCDGTVDENIVSTDWTIDADGDGFGDASATPVNDCAAPPLHVGNADDCDDVLATVNPSVPEVTCDGVDNDCDPSTLDDLGCDTGDTGTDTGLPTDGDADTDTDTDTDADTDTDTDADTDTDTDTDTGTDATTASKAPEPAAPDYGCGCVSGAPSASWTVGLLPLLAVVRRRSAH